MWKILARTLRSAFKSSGGGGNIWATKPKHETHRALYGTDAGPGETPEAAMVSALVRHLESTEVHMVRGKRVKTWPKTGAALRSYGRKLAPLLFMLSQITLGFPDFLLCGKSAGHPVLPLNGSIK